jgi:hypothetical protein
LSIPKLFELNQALLIFLRFLLAAVLPFFANCLSDCFLVVVELLFFLELLLCFPLTLLLILAFGDVFDGVFGLGSLFGFEILSILSFFTGGSLDFVLVVVDDVSCLLDIAFVFVKLVSCLELELPLALRAVSPITAGELLQVV